MLGTLAPGTITSSQLRWLRGRVQHKQIVCDVVQHMISRRTSGHLLQEIMHTLSARDTTSAPHAVTRCHTQGCNDADYVVRGMR